MTGMPGSPSTPQVECWADAVTLQPAASYDLGVPRFEMIETRGPDPRALLFSTTLLVALVSLFAMLGRIQNTMPASRAEYITLWVAPTALEAPSPPAEITPRRYPGRDSVHRLRAPEGVAARLRPEGVPKAPPAPLVTERISPPLVVAEPISRSPAEQPEAAAIEPERTGPPPAPLASPVSKPPPKPAEPDPTPSEAKAMNLNPVGRESLGGLPLSQLMENQETLAAGLEALPWAERLNLPRVSIRVNAEWIAALPKTQERLYFSVSAPQADREVLAYLPETHHFLLERPEHPLWQIHEAEQVPALAELRTAAARLLGVSPALVGLYTWHPPVLENALRMFVLERMQELHANLGPRDVVTVRLAAGANGAVMNLEPIRGAPLDGH